jgi:rhodanese-related sulfurtransferase
MRAIVGSSARLDGWRVVRYTRRKVKSVSPKDVQALIESGEVELIDVREHHEWQTGHIPGARHVPLSRLRQTPKAYLNRDKLVFVCAAGARSNLAAQLAVAHGFTQVYNLTGGTRAWTSAGLTLIAPQEQATG